MENLEKPNELSVIDDSDKTTILDVFEEILDICRQHEDWPDDYSFNDKLMKLIEGKIAISVEVPEELVSKMFTGVEGLLAEGKLMFGFDCIRDSVGHEFVADRVQGKEGQNIEGVVIDKNYFCLLETGDIDYDPDVARDKNLWDTLSVSIFYSKSVDPDNKRRSSLEIIHNMNVIKIVSGVPKVDVYFSLGESGIYRYPPAHLASVYIRERGRAVTYDDLSNIE